LMVQVPDATPVTVLPEIVQIVGVAEVKVTASAELAVAVTVPVPPTNTVGAAPNVIACDSLPTVIAWDTCGAALKLALPA